jgi:acyl carrier protein
VNVHLGSIPAFHFYPASVEPIERRIRDKVTRVSRRALLQFVNEQLLTGAEPTIAIDTPLFEDGRIDSLKLLRLIAFVEEQSNRSIPDELIVKEPFALSQRSSSERGPA